MGAQTKLSVMLGRDGAVLHSSSLGMFQRLVDLAVIVATGLGVNLLLGFESLLPIVFSFLFAALFVITGEAYNLYHSWRAQPLAEEVMAILLSAVTALLLAGIIVYPLAWLVPGMSGPLEKHGLLGSLLSTLMWSALIILVLLAYRIALRTLLRVVRIAGLNSKPVLLVGAAAHRELLEQRMAMVPWYGFEVVGGVDIKMLSCPEGRAALVARAHAGEFANLYLMGGVDREGLAGLLTELADAPVSTFLVPDIFFNELIHPRVYSIAGVPAIGITTSPLLGSAGWLKRAEDVVFSSLILILISVPMLLIAVAIKLSSKGPVIFRQVRYGLDGRPIRVKKFRTMTVCENGDDICQATKGDQRVTRLGAVLRCFSLDELPQFFNVLRGEMSIVGPRPHAKAHNEYYRRLIPSYMLRHKLKPGITGWAQINGWRGETAELYKMEKRVEFDLHYIRNWSIWFDIHIILLTVFKVWFSKDVY